MSNGRTSRSSIRWGLAALALLFSPVMSLAQPSPGSYPDRAVRVIVPFAPAGPTDVVARLVAQKLSERLGRQFYIENVTGAGGNTGMGQAARAAADGYTVLLVSSSFVVNPSLYPKIPYDRVSCKTVGRL
jgi:tripartite-type tricarboxylate transporter receptor subunit TctC